MSLFSGKNGVTMGTGNEFGTPVHLTNETILGGTMGKKNKISLIHWMHVPQIHGGCPRLLHGHRPHPVIFVPIEEHIFEIESIPFPPTVLPRSAQLQLPIPLRSNAGDDGDYYNEQLPLFLHLFCPHGRTHRRPTPLHDKRRQSTRKHMDLLLDTALLTDTLWIELNTASIKVPQPVQAPTTKQVRPLLSASTTSKCIR
jgi:hypothetical protein